MVLSFVRTDKTPDHPPTVGVAKQLDCPATGHLQSRLWTLVQEFVSSMTTKRATSHSQVHMSAESLSAMQVSEICGTISLAKY